SLLSSHTIMVYPAGGRRQDSEMTILTYELVAAGSGDDPSAVGAEILAQPLDRLVERVRVVLGAPHVLEDLAPLDRPLALGQRGQHVEALGGQMAYQPAPSPDPPEHRVQPDDALLDLGPLLLRSGQPLQRVLDRLDEIGGRERLLQELHGA